MKELLIDSFKDALFDTVKLIPFLLITYVVMEWLERKTAGRQAHVLGKAEKLGPLIGGVLGIVPQCRIFTYGIHLYRRRRDRGGRAHSRVHVNLGRDAADHAVK